MLGNFRRNKTSSLLSISKQKIWKQTVLFSFYVSSRPGYFFPWDKTSERRQNKTRPYCIEWKDNFLTESFPTLEHQNPSIGEFYVVQKLLIGSFRLLMRNAWLGRLQSILFFILKWCLFHLKSEPRDVRLTQQINYSTLYRDTRPDIWLFDRLKMGRWTFLKNIKLEHQRGLGQIMNIWGSTQFDYFQSLKKTLERRFWATHDIPIDEFRGSEMEKCSVGLGSTSITIFRAFVVTWLKAKTQLKKKKLHLFPKFLKFSSVQEKKIAAVEEVNY